MFIDKAKVSIKAGSGGNGNMSFRHEKFIDKGGPDGGDGGHGGDVIFVASDNHSTLAKFRHDREILGENGEKGGTSNKHGASGDDLEVFVPVGTSVFDNKGNLLFDLERKGVRRIIAKGGRGGYGNAHFTSSVRQAPRIAELGERGEEIEALLEIRMIADVGLVGLPNAGKSTLLSVVSDAKPEIADYPFTTLKPNLGVVKIDEQTSLLFADIPGMIEGASEGKGLGDEFLKHVERTKVLLHLIDAWSNDIVADYNVIRQELAAYKIDLSTKPYIVALSKIEGLDKDLLDMQVEALRSVVPKEIQILAFSAVAHQNLQSVLYAISAVATANKIEQQTTESELSEIPVITLEAAKQDWWVDNVDGMIVVHGDKIARFAERTNFESEEGVQRLKDILKRTGVLKEIRRAQDNLDELVRFADRPDIEPFML
jgi:GTPase